MKIYKGYPGHWSNTNDQKSCIQEVDLPKSEDPKEWTMVTLKSMKRLMQEYNCWFDCYGNLVNGKDHLAPSFFYYLGHSFHVKKGCGLSTKEDCGWLWACEPIDLVAEG